MSRTLNLGLGRPVDEAVATALGWEHRSDPVHRRTGGPAGNARLTAWIGLTLLLLFIAECVTLISMHQLIDVHIIVGGVLVPLTLVKTATTGWRILRYYTGKDSYVDAGPPPLLQRLLGPLVILGALAVLGTGLSLVAIGTDATFSPWFSVVGFSVSPLTLHQVAFILWLAVTALHVLARTVPAVNLISSKPSTVPGRTLRAAVLVLTAAAAVVTAALLLHYSSEWTNGWAHQAIGGEH